MFLSELFSLLTAKSLLYLQVICINCLHFTYFAVKEPNLIPHTNTQLMILVLYEYLNQVWRCFNSSVYYYKCVRRLNCEFLVLLNRGTEPHPFMTASQTIITVSVIVLPIMLDKLNLNTLYWDCNLLLCSLLYILNVGQLADLFFILGCNFL